jgi:hypothetical protein
LVIEGGRQQPVPLGVHIHQQHAAFRRGLVGQAQRQPGGQVYRGCGFANPALFIGDRDGYSHTLSPRTFVLKTAGYRKTCMF